MSASVDLNELAELREQLRNLPEALANEAQAIVLAHAEQAGQTVESGYPEGPTGNLKGGVTVITAASRLTAGAIVRSRAKHAAIFEKGTRPRRTSNGANRGVMPAASPAQAFIPKAIRARRNMYNALKIMLQREGFTVGGDV